ncbi:MAG TPA: epoxide hydrolase, partial [Acidimicrobiales bacterium]
MSTEITPFRIDVPEAVLTDLRDRLRRTRWPEAETVDDWSQGIPLTYMQDLCRYWTDEYDWRRSEARLNAFPQFRTTIDGLGIHFVHVRSPGEDALPLIITHGWPGSIVEFHKVIGPLTDPAAHGGDPADAFHVVCPSLPGYGFSDKPARHGWGVDRIARAWAELMARLGYRRYGAQGGDWGAAVTTSMGHQDVEHLAGTHLNMPVALPDPATMGDLSEAEQAALAALTQYDQWDSGYSKQQSTRPQTLGYGLVDSPAGECAWIVEKFWSWTDCDGDPLNVLTRDDLLDNVMLYWVPGTGASSGRLYWESLRHFDREPVAVPTGCSIFPKEIIRS